MQPGAPLIIVSDDDRLLVQMLADRFRRAGFTVLEDLHSKVTSLSEEFQPDLVLLDVYQEVLGLQLLAWLKQNPKTWAIPVIVMTATPGDDHRVFCQQMGANGYTKKPLDEAAVARFARMAVESFERSRRLRR